MPRFSWSFVLLSCLLLMSPAALACPHPVSERVAPSDAESRAGDVQPAADYEATLTELLQKVVTGKGLVRYNLLRGALNTDFRRVLKAVEEFDTNQLNTQNERLAFWMNAYNVQMLQNIIETPKVNNIVDDGYADAFFKTAFRTAQMDVSLDEIENVILRGNDGRKALVPFQLKTLEPRIHVGLNCAAVSCPRLRQRAFTAANLDAELDAAMRDFTSSPAHFRVEGETVVLSSLLDWYGADFDRPGQPAGSYLLRFMPRSRPNYDALKAALQGKSASDLKQQSSVSYEYKWTVNAAS